MVVDLPQEKWQRIINMLANKYTYAEVAELISDLGRQLQQQSAQSPLPTGDLNNRGNSHERAIAER